MQMIIDIRDTSNARAEVCEKEKTEKRSLQHYQKRMDNLRKRKLWQQKQGGITGEKKNQGEKLLNVYSSVMSYQGKPSNSQIERLDGLNSEVIALEQKSVEYQK